MTCIFIRRESLKRAVTRCIREVSLKEVSDTAINRQLMQRFNSRKRQLYLDLELSSLPSSAESQSSQFSFSPDASS